MAPFNLEEQAQFDVNKLRLITFAGKIEKIVNQGRLAQRDNKQLFLFKGMHRELKNFYDSFVEAYDLLVQLCVSHAQQKLFPLEEDTLLMETTESFYFEACAIYEDSMNPTPVSDASVLGHNKSFRSRLPKITIPDFDGDPQKWCLFRDTFVSLIHEDDTLSDIEKFHFLTCALKGPALAIIRNIPVNADNYEQAWDAITSQYNNKRILAWSYLKAILEFKPVTDKPSAKSLKAFLTIVVENIAALNNLSLIDLKDFILFSLALRCLDPNTRKCFEQKYSDVDFPKYDQLIDFVKSEWRTLDLMSESFTSRDYSGSKIQSWKTPTNSFNRSKTSLFVGKKQNSLNLPHDPCFSSHLSATPNLKTDLKNNFSCPACSQQHSLYQCSKFKEATPEERFAFLKNWSGCSNCLSPKHSKRNCRSTKTCLTCQKKHHSWLHFTPRTLVTVAHDPGEVVQLNETPQAVTLGGLGESEVMLGTALVRIKDKSGNYHYARAVTDGGSQYSFITEHFAAKLGLKIKPMSCPISGIGQTPLQHTKGCLHIHICSLHDDKEIFTDAIIVPKITGNLPHTQLSMDFRLPFSKYTLADPTFWRPGSIDVLIGADLYFDIISGSPIILNNHVPKLLPSILGYLVVGKGEHQSTVPGGSALLVSSQDEMSTVMSQFWAVEEVSSMDTTSNADRECEEHYCNSVTRDYSGRYSVSLPFKSLISSLKNNRQTAMKRFLNLEARLEKDSVLKEQYHSFMREYLTLGHMHLAAVPGKYIIPHHCISKTVGNKKKFRVVFDGSCGNPSLNDCLMTGPKLQTDISHLLLKFRIHQVGFTGDIIKMFRQIKVNSNDRLFQHIFWRFDPSDEVSEYELNTITYGLGNSPYSAIRTLQQLVQDEGHRYPLAAKVLLNDFYVDDAVSGGESDEEVLAIIQQLIDLLRCGQLELDKWGSNSHTVLQSIPTSSPVRTSVDFSTNDNFSITLLGMQWLPIEDIFTYEITAPSVPCTKRSILSAIARIYDPLGYLAPVVFMAKTILQQTWLCKIDWDEDVPINIHNQWTVFVDQLYLLSSVKIPRCISFSSPSSYHFIGFCDASEKGYAACCYLKSIKNEEIKVSLIKAKTKLAPTKPMSIPRLELSGALLLTRLYSSCTNIISALNITKVSFFTDSKVILYWLNTPPANLKTFVAHRVVAVLENTSPSQWRHVPTAENAADSASRGMLPSELVNNELWWTGPQWLQLPEGQWPSWSPQNSTVDCNLKIPELKLQPNTKVALLAHDSDKLMNIIKGFSSLRKLVKFTAIMIRFYRWHNSSLDGNSPISVEELRNAEVSLIRYVQGMYFFSGSLPTAASLDKNKVLRPLNPFIDTRGVIRVGGRIKHSSTTYDFKHPIILPGKCHFTHILIDYYHLSYMHAGPTALRAMLLTRYWIISAKIVVRQRIRLCIKCFKYNRPTHTPFMGDLPAYRLTEGQVFKHVGVDFGGPFQIRDSLRRRPQITKCYLCLFICLSSKALHLEVVSSLTTDAFLASFDRFVSRRGCPAQMFSDCGLNFVGAANKLRSIYLWLRSDDVHKRISHFASEHDIKWNFNPPYAPHFGGIWEAGIKSAKALLRKSIGEACLTFEELTTVFSKIEAMLNSRPLCPVNNDPDSFETLTPAHFLIGRSFVALPEENLSDEKISPLRRWKLLQQQTQHFWHRWRLEYLNQLQQRSKWLTPQRNLEIGDLVLVKEHSSPPGKWPVGRVVKTSPGKDNIVRVVTVKTPRGVYQRPAVNVIPFPLPLPGNDEGKISSQF